MIVWARTEQGKVNGFLVEHDPADPTPGFEATVMTGKTALRAVWQAEITLKGVRVDESHRLPGCESFRDTAAVLTRTRSPPTRPRWPTRASASSSASR